MLDETNSTPEVLGWVKGTSCYYPITRIGTNGDPFCSCKGWGWRKKCRHMEMFKNGDFAVDMKFRITFNDGDKEIIVEGDKLLNSDDLIIEVITDNIFRTE